MDDLISREDAIDAAKHAWAKGLEPSQYIEIIPSVHAVPLEPLAKWIVENLDPSIDCKTCAESPRNYECACLPCPPMTEKQVKEALEKWKEEQDAADRR